MAIMLKELIIKIKNFFFNNKKEIKQLTNEELLIEIENAIFQANAKHEYCVDLCYEVPREIIGKLLEKGYQISTHQVTDYSSCYEYEEFPGGTLFTGNPTILKKTKICW